MKKSLPAILFFVLLSVIAAGQKFNPNKYTIKLPGYWKPGNKVWRILSDKLPLVCEELKDKELCGDGCRPKYSVELYITAPEITDYYPSHISTGTNVNGGVETWEFTTYYSFNGYLLLWENENKLLTKLVLTDTDEIWMVKNRAELRSYTPAPPTNFFRRIPGIAVASNEFGAAVAQAGQEGQTPYSYINRNRQLLDPKERDLYAVIDEKIRLLESE